MDGTTPCRGRLEVDPAHKHPKGALCAAGGCYPPLQSAPLDETVGAALPAQCLLTLWKKFYADFLLLSSAFFAIIEKILGKYTLAAFGECCGGYL